MSFRIDQEWLDDRLSLVRLSGELDLYAAPELRKVVLAHHRSRTSLICDLTGAALIDSTILGLFVQVNKDLAVHGGGLHVVCPDDGLAQVFRVTALTRVMPLYDTISEAIATAQRGRDERGGPTARG